MFPKLVNLRLRTKLLLSFVLVTTGLTFATLLITQQSAIFVGLMTRTYALIEEIPQVDLWVADPTLQFVDDTKPMQVTALQRVRSVDGVQWAVPLFKSLLVAKLPSGARQLCDVVGVDDATLIGAPATVVQGKVEDLRKPDAIFVETRGAAKQLAQPATADPNGPKRPMPAMMSSPSSGCLPIWREARGLAPARHRRGRVRGVRGRHSAPVVRAAALPAPLRGDPARARRQLRARPGAARRRMDQAPCRQ